MKNHKDKYGVGTVKEIARTTKNLLPLILKHVAPGSIVMTDKWSSYRTVPKYPTRDPGDSSKLCPDRLKYKHFGVNHGEEFVSADDPFVHCNGVERMWRDMKEWMARPGQRRMYLRQYIARYQVLVGFPERANTPTEMKEARLRREAERLHRALQMMGELNV